MERVAIRTAKANAGAINEGSDGDEVAGSTARRVYAASIANNPKAVTLAARHAHTRAAVRTAKANAKAVNEGSDGEEAVPRGARLRQAASPTTPRQ